MGSYRNASRTLFVITLLFWFAQYCYTPYLNAALETMGATATFIGFVSGCYGFTQLVTRIPLGLATDKYHLHKQGVLIGCLLCSTAAFGMYFFYTPVGFLFFRGISGFAAATWVSFTVLYSNYFSNETSAIAISWLNVANQGGRLLCFICVSLLVPYAGVKSSFLLAGFVSLFAAILCIGIRPSPTTDRAPVGFRESLSVLKNEHLRNCTILAILSQLIAFSTYNSFITNYAVSINATVSQLSYMNIALMLPIVITNYATSRWLLVKVGAKRLLLVGFAASCVYCFAIPLCDTMSQVMLLQVVAGISNSLTLSVVLSVCVQEISQTLRASAMGFFQALYGIGMTLGPILMGCVTDLVGLSQAFVGIGFLSVFSLLVTFKLLPSAKATA